MAYILGTDEAGYGPNLGPLVISATLWRVPDEKSEDDLYALLKGAVSSEPSDAANGKIILGDSKVLYQPGRGLGLLERSLFSLLSVMGKIPKSWREVWEILSPKDIPRLQNVPWHDGFEQTLPREAQLEGIVRDAETLRRTLEEAGIALVDMKSRVIFPEEFNARIEVRGNKGSVLTEETLKLAREMSAACHGETLAIECDKHGGRNHYLPVLQNAFPEEWIEIVREGRDESLYTWGGKGSGRTAAFRVKGERFLPSAAASMASKYLREVAMWAFNDYWCARVENLRPTAGYPLDAKRFRREIHAAQTKLGIGDAVLWRSR